MKILMLTDFYYPKPLANGICISKIAKELAKNYDVKILSFRGLNENYEYNIDGITVYKVNTRLFYYMREFGEINNNKFIRKFVYKIAMLIQKVKKMMFICWFPLTSPIFVLKFYRAAKKICIDNNIDIVISSYNPLEAAIIGMLLKKNKVVKKNVFYVIDTLTNKYQNKTLIAQLFSYLGWKWEKKIFNYSDMIINMICYREMFINKRYDTYRNKLFFADIPYIEKYDINKYKTKNKNINNIQFVYAGALIRNMRNPENVCRVFNEYNKKYKNAYLCFYSRGDCEDIIDNYSQLSNDRIKKYGYVKKNELDKIIFNSDIIITIGNKNSQMISSKVFEYIALNKKIIHFYSDINDRNIDYLKKYPNSLLINESDDMEINVKKITEFIDMEVKNIDYTELSKIFYMNTPKYTSDLIEEAIRGE